MLVAGIDLAWGERQPDGLVWARYRRGRAIGLGADYPRGDDALIAALAAQLRAGESAFLAIDAPLVIPNGTGTRPVDRLTHRLFHREHAGCHPANRSKCPRPPRVMARLAAELGFQAGWEWPARGQTAPGASPARVAAEVYPHPAMVRLFRLPRILKYKKGPVRERRREFARYRRLLRALLDDQFAFLEAGPAAPWLRAPWTKPAEDRLDALFCLLIALWHLHHRGRCSETIGDLATGFILLPADRR
jgi:predicted RNase H-like nuclease